MNIRNLFKSHFPAARRVVYTCMFGYSEKFLDLHYDCDDRTDFICFTDNPNLTSVFWDIRIVKPVAMDPVRQAKRIKRCFFDFLPEYEKSLYIDNTVRITSTIDEIFYHLDDSMYPLCMFRHPWRDCVYDEAEVIIDSNIDDRDVVESQMQLYRQLGHPRHVGLFATTIMLRDHRSQHLRKVMTEWHLQIVRHSYRDQLSFPVITRLTGLTVSPLPGLLTENSLIEWPVMKTSFRMPRDFNDQRYYQLHPDVLEARMDAREHYFKYGASERRPYK